MMSKFNILKLPYRPFVAKSQIKPEITSKTMLRAASAVSESLGVVLYRYDAQRNTTAATINRVTTPITKYQNQCKGRGRSRLLFFGFMASKFCPQYRHIIASYRICSAQNGHFFVL
jgi:hypothetical protein